MMNKLLKFAMNLINSLNERDDIYEKKRLEVIEEIESLEVELAKKMADAERWGDLSDKTDWRTVEVNRIKRLIDSKMRVISNLKR